MKKKLIVFLFLAFYVTGCSSEVIDKGEHVIPEQLPFSELKINDESFSLKDISIYQEKATSGHGYYPYVIVTFDKTSLSEEEFYWMLEDNTIDVSCYIDSEQNDIDFDSVPKLKSYYDDNTLVYIFDDYEEAYRYDFSDVEATIVVTLTQEEEYEYKQDDGKTGKLNKQNRYTFYVNHISEITSDVKDISELSDSEEKMRQIGLREAYEKHLASYNYLLNH